MTDLERSDARRGWAVVAEDGRRSRLLEQTERGAQHRQLPGGVMRLAKRGTEREGDR